mgnify:CR=1 FL=1
MMGWKPIETAPKGRTVILAAHEFWRGAGLIHWLDGSWCHYVDGTKVAYPQRLTHWMPLPPPPQRESRE